MSLEHDPARQKLHGRTNQARAPPDLDVDAMSIKEFCRRHSISEPFYHKLQKLGLGPKTLKAGARTLITAEAAARWRRASERATRQLKHTTESSGRPAATR
jgi:hypothetical protein